MGLITTLVDLKLGLLLVESPRCKEKIQIELSPAQPIGKREVLVVHSQRYKISVPGKTHYAFDHMFVSL